MRPSWLLLLCLACEDPAGDPISTDAGPTPVVDAQTLDATSPAPDARAEVDAAPPGVGDAGGADAAPLHWFRGTQPLLPTPARAPGEGACARYKESRCHEGRLQRCLIAHPEGLEPPDLLRRIYLFERWYELYHAPDGQTANRNLTTPTPAGTPEAEWGALENFGGFDAIGDSAIWTGVGMTSAALRYASTGSEADYARMERKARRVLDLFEVTGIPGYLARHHFLVAPEGHPPSDQRILKHLPGWTPGEHDRPAAARLGYPEGVGEVMWNGHPSIDQYSGPLVGLVAAWDLLRDEDLKARITHHLTCYLNRLRRYEIVNVQSNPQAMELIRVFLGSEGVRVDEGDVDLMSQDRFVFFVHPQINDRNAEGFDLTCPEGPPTIPHEIIDAARDDFMARMLEFVAMATTPHAEAFDHHYGVSITGHHAIAVMWLAALSHHLTGAQVYADFLERDLIEDLRAHEVAGLVGSFIAPRWCRRYYPDHILMHPLWGLTRILAPGPLKARMWAVMEEDMWGKIMASMRNLKYDLLYIGEVPEAMASGRDEAITRVREDLEAMGGNGGILDDPRRAYSLTREVVLEHLPEGNEPICPTEAQRAHCEAGFEVMGLTVDAVNISYPCDGRLAECVMEDGLCVEAQAALGVPISLRPYEGFMWEGSGYRLHREFGVEGLQQAPGLDLIEPYWLARLFGLRDEDAGWGLSWVDEGACP